MPPFQKKVTTSDTNVDTVDTPVAAPAGPAYTLDELKAIVAAGMSVGDAKALLDSGYTPDAVLELAQLQSSRQTVAAAEAQSATAKAMQKAMKPENDTHPDKSVFNYPEGNVARPKPTLPFAFLYNGYPIHKFPETQHWRELELAAQVQPGTYTVLRKDASQMKVEVTADRDADGNITKIDVHFPISREEKALVPPQAVVLYQIVHPENPRKAFVESMQEWLNLTVWQQPIAV